MVEDNRREWPFGVGLCGNDLQSDARFAGWYEQLAEFHGARRRKDLLAFRRAYARSLAILISVTLSITDNTAAFGLAMASTARLRPVALAS